VLFLKQREKGRRAEENPLSPLLLRYAMCLLIFHWPCELQGPALSVNQKGTSPASGTAYYVAVARCLSLFSVATTKYQRLENLSGIEIYLVHGFGG
jgi:hypothetical protein